MVALLFPPLTFKSDTLITGTLGHPDPSGCLYNKHIRNKLMDDLRTQLVTEHGEDVISYYETLFSNELEIFKERYCGYVGDLETWAQKCLDSCYDGYEDDDIPSLESFIQLEFWDHFDYNEDLGIGFLLV